MTETKPSALGAAMDPKKTAASHTSQNQVIGNTAGTMSVAFVYAVIKAVRGRWPEYMLWPEDFDEWLAGVLLVLVNTQFSRIVAFLRDPSKALRSDVTDSEEN